MHAESWILIIFVLFLIVCSCHIKNKGEDIKNKI